MLYAIRFQIGKHPGARDAILLCMTAARTPRTTRPRRRPPRLTPARFIWRLLLAALKISLLLAGLGAIAVLLAYRYYSQDLPDPMAIGRYRPAETTRIYARDGVTLLDELVDPQGGRRTIIPLSEIPQTLKDATVAVEDAGFYENPGVDLRGILRAIFLNYEAGEVVSGGSTITQQLVRNVLLPPSQRTSQSLERKLREAILAVQVSREYSKDQILSLYLNEVYYGSQAYGVEAAAQTYFGKHVADLTLGEATLIAGLPQSPTVLNPFSNPEGARGRQRVTLDQMVKVGLLSPEESDRVAAAPIQLTPPVATMVAPHFAFYVRDLLERQYGPDQLYRGGLRVVTTLDVGWQAEAQRIVRERVAELQARSASNAALIMLAPNGQILAMVGSADYTNPAIDGEVNVALAERQPGSALKPVVYAAAMQKGWTPATIIWDTPVSYPSGDGAVYAPRNYDNQWHGPQRLRMALANSLNIPAIKALEYAGVEPFIELAHRMGITTLNDPARYGLPLALGAGEVRLIDLTNVYSTIRNGGRFHEPVAIHSVTNARGAVLARSEEDPGRQVLGRNGEQLAYLLTDMLSDNTAREYMFGPNNVMALPDSRPAAVKTGTSNEWRDSWAVGFTPDVTIGVWVGNSDSTPMQEIAGSNGAGLIWRDLMISYHTGRPVLGFALPPGVEEATICAATGALAGPECPSAQREVFVAGTAPSTSAITLAKIKVSKDGRCLAASYTPQEDMREETFVIYPPDQQQEAARAGVPQPPTQYCAPPAPKPGQPGSAVAAITTPSANTTLRGEVLVRGSARGTYVLEVGSGVNPKEWKEIARSSSAVADGILGMWSTASLTPGTYTLRLRVTTSDQVPADARSIVRVVR
jgi:1A family penicillin-binding protein